jgi:hypothetical protein
MSTVEKNRLTLFNLTIEDPPDLKSAPLIYNSVGAQDCSEMDGNQILDLGRDVFCPAILAETMAGGCANLLL